MRRSLAALPFLLAACAAAPAPPAPSAARTTALAAAPAPAAEKSDKVTERVAWTSFDDTTFARAKVERRFVVLDGAAEWCHFCHVMEEKTYADPRVRELLGKHFVATKVDVDARPDIEERYGDWGWPATVIFSPDGEELGKYRGFIPPDEFVEILNTVVAGGAKPLGAGEAEAVKVPKTPLADDALDLLARFSDLELEEYWDKKEGGWGREPKVPIGWNTLYALARAKQGDARLRGHALEILDKQRKIVDPVWGGIYQYSVAPDWDHPHYEKLMFWNAGAMASYAEAFALTKDPKQRDRANDIRRWLDAFMTSADGTFYGTQDADLNAHPASVPFAPTSPRGKGELVKGEDYYELGDKERRALGVPRIDPNEYADDNGFAIFAYATLAEATGDASALASAKRDADAILKKHKTASGGLAHLPDPNATKLHLSDAAAVGFGLVRLYEVSKETRWRDEADALGAFVQKSLYDDVGGGFFSQTRDDNAVGVFRVRRKPFEDNVLALRFLVRLDAAHATAARRDVIEHSLRALATPDRIKDRGKFLGDFLSLLDEVRAHRRLPRRV